MNIKVIFGGRIPSEVLSALFLDAAIRAGEHYARRRNLGFSDGQIKSEMIPRIIAAAEKSNEVLTPEYAELYINLSVSIYKAARGFEFNEVELESMLDRFFDYLKQSALKSELTKQPDYAKN